MPLHWHAHTDPKAPRDRKPEAALDDPYQVATWLAERTEAHLWQSHLLVASQGDSIRRNGLVVHAVLNENCEHECMSPLTSRPSAGREMFLTGPA